MTKRKGGSKAKDVVISIGGVPLNPADYVTDEPVIVDANPGGIQLSSASNEHYTPADIVERARRLMGRIDLDPASCVHANGIVQAKRYYAQDAVRNDGDYAGEGIQGDGLAMRPWKGAVFLNPPGGAFKMHGKGFSNAALWWAALVQDWLSGDVEQAIFIGFTLEILRHSQMGSPLPVQAFHRCYPKKRIKFTAADGTVGAQPGHANVIVYLPPLSQVIRSGDPARVMRDDLEDDFNGLVREFGSLGYCE